MEQCFIEQTGAGLETTPDEYTGAGLETTPDPTAVWEFMAGALTQASQYRESKTDTAPRVALHFLKLSVVVLPLEVARLVFSTEYMRVLYRLAQSAMKPKAAQFDSTL